MNDMLNIAISHYENHGEFIKQCKDGVDMLLAESSYIKDKHGAKHVCRYEEMFIDLLSTLFLMPQQSIVRRIMKMQEEEAVNLY